MRAYSAAAGIYGAPNEAPRVISKTLRRKVDRSITIAHCLWNGPGGRYAGGSARKGSLGPAFLGLPLLRVAVLMRGCVSDGECLRKVQLCAEFSHCLY